MNSSGLLSLFSQILSQKKRRMLTAGIATCPQSKEKASFERAACLAYGKIF
jgi:hypothetical protein